MYVATGASGAFYMALLNLVGSVRYWCPDCGVAVFNLGGLSETQLRFIRGLCRVRLHWARGVPYQQKHVKEGGKYAWKPLAIREAAQSYGRVLWLDGGSVVTGPLRTVRQALDRDGAFLVKGQDAGVRGWVHTGMLTWFNKTNDDLPEHESSFSGNTVGFVKGSELYERVVPRWCACALDEACISPYMAASDNHRYDQSALSTILYTTPGLPAYGDYTYMLAVQREGRCFRPWNTTIWTARGIEGCYRPAASEDCDMTTWHKMFGVDEGQLALVGDERGPGGGLGAAVEAA